jgi:hypothetical protein
MGELDERLDNQLATAEAQHASENANLSAAAAAGATVAQAQLIEATMAAGREDSQRAAEAAQAAEAQTEAAANDAVTTNVAVMGAFQRFHDEMLERIGGLENKLLEAREPAPTINLQADAGDGVSSIDPNQVSPEGAEDGDAGGEEAPAPSSSKRKRKHGRGRR